MVLCGYRGLWTSLCDGCGDESECGCLEGGCPVCAPACAAHIRARELALAQAVDQGLAEEEVHPPAQLLAYTLVRLERCNLTAAIPNLLRH